ncbi:acyl-CoA thioesterase II [Hamiltosporidium tvaerminnensis]|uniref:Acyl-CoA thioesterase II n=2 Tax=Hamiltosporidium TaxID=1176354 RepID=A0A4Q9LRD6_9MICR|nr:hypothetical protein LUQ84_3633 [Hamiltosporidium tvaerminnensis]TBU06748.1 acyl-CoA thioesterase II [Hamiltosporidium magnivora]TBT99428.1 acyl-CoA thioesterase II [Hamiltosporidium tvaerminnensis]TBU09990.1 acyl-CoA thioesterase II [Hamiltosporidium magnivora]TBU10008.1 acyl-CoA thioesterase II [Hamiltosporidium magnivora]
MDFIKVNNCNEEWYESENLWTPFPGSAVFGGQIVAQALNSALRTLNKDFRPHSLHIYFHKPGINSKVIKYEIEDLRSGKTLVSKRITGKQENDTIVTMEASFSKEEISKYEFQSEKFEIYEDRFTELTAYFESVLPKANHSLLLHLSEFKKNFDIFIGEPKNNKRQIKIKIKENFEEYSDISCIMAFVSDFMLIEPALIPLNKNILSPDIAMCASIDHTLYFHSFEKGYSGEFIYLVECLKFHNSKALCIGHLLNSENVLMATAIQEGIIRFKEK